ncbi:DUF1330 domain-containing protein [Actinocatenispora sera]|uniref:DUF1330 domain-containing protein n=1 Tax=Actinocatenispora sera TaxID=390989 RepID=UPI0033CB163C
MTGYALARLNTPGKLQPEVFEYLERIQGTLDPYGGRFLIHGGRVEVKEGGWSGDVILIGFPTAQHARDWYDSPAYQQIKHLRGDHIGGDVLIIEGEPADHDSAAMAAALRAAARS